MFLSHPLFSLHPNNLQLFLYYDHVELCNPLRSKKHKHKFGECFINYILYYACNRCVLLFIGWFKTTLLYKDQPHSITGPCETKLYITKYSINKILEPFVRDIPVLVSESDLFTYITLTVYRKVVTAFVFKDIPK